MDTLRDYYPNTFDIERSPIPRVFSYDVYYAFFSKKNLHYISEQITQRLEGTHPQHKHIIVPIETIISVMDSIYNNTTRDIDKMTMMTISYIVEHIRNEYETEQQNYKLSNWVLQYTEDTTLRRHPEIKLRHKRPTPMIFNMNY